MLVWETLWKDSGLECINNKSWENPRLCKPPPDQKKGYVIMFMENK